MISVIIPIFNSEKWLKQCINSILDQTYRNIEVILVDDGSTDSSGTICDQYAEKDDRVRVIHQKNGRIARARNAGIEAAKGEYLSFIDSDDFFKPETLETALNLMKRYKADMVQWDLEYLNDEDTLGDEHGVNKPHTPVVDFVVSNLEAIRIMLDTHHPDDRFNNICQCCNCVWPKLFKKSLFADVRFPVDREYEDLAIVHRLYKAANKVVFTNARFSVYRLRSSSVVHSMSIKGTVDGLDAYADKYEMLATWEDCDTKVCLGMAAHTFLSTAITTSTLASHSEEIQRVKDIVRRTFGANGNFKRNLPSSADKLMYRIYLISPKFAYVILNLRRKIRK